jgi:hypothetical protein
MVQLLACIIDQLLYIFLISNNIRGFIDKQKAQCIILNYMYNVHNLGRKRRE